MLKKMWNIDPVCSLIFLFSPGRFDTKVLPLPCDCKIAGFTFDEVRSLISLRNKKAIRKIYNLYLKLSSFFLSLFSSLRMQSCEP